MKRALLTVVALLTFATTAHATEDFCAVVLKTPDGFLALREGPGTPHKMITKLEQGDFLLADTAMGEQDPKNIKWVHINGVPRVDGPDAIGKTYTRGWVARRYVQTLLCPDDQAAAARP
jgi:hypothetical protein